MRILFAEDDLRLGNLIQHMLRKEGYDIDWVRAGDLAFEYATESHYDIIILDWMMPVESGLTVCRRLREIPYGGGILLLTAKDTTDDRVLGLDAGADDYLVKPFEFKELLARLRAISRRNARSWKPKEERIIVADLEIDRQSRKVIRGKREIKLTVREFQLLNFLAQHYGQVLPRGVIIDRIWGHENEISQNNLDAFMRLLRKKIEFPGEDQLIHNIRGIGFRMGVENAK